MSMKRWVLFLVAGLLGLAVGAASALAVLRAPDGFTGRTVDGWRVNPLAGASAADPYTRALIARVGLLALSAEETVYFTASTDSQGAALDPHCAYRLSGQAPSARWWSITLYAEDHYLARNADDAASVDATSLTLGPDGLDVRVSPDRGEAEAWLSTRNAGRFTLTLRLYQPAEAVRRNLLHLDMPQIDKISCQGAIR